MISKTLLVVVVVNLIFDYSYGQGDKKFFRKDYKYLEELEGLYKFHTLHKTLCEAKQVCELEGAQLFYPENEKEAKVVLKFWTDAQPYRWLLMGISDLVAKGIFETIDGKPLSDVYDNWAIMQPDNLGGKEDCVIMRRDGTLNDVECEGYPFVCKKSLRTLKWNQQCNMPEQKGQKDRKFFRKDYTYLEDAEGFYKFHTVPKTFSESQRVCELEGAKLFYPENEDEAEAVKTFWKSIQTSGYITLGISDLLAKGLFETIDGKPISDVYHNWLPGEPNNAGGSEDCVGMTTGGQFSDHPCNNKAQFICKRSLQTLKWNQKCNIPNLDYHFNEDTGNCYILHTTPLTWAEAYATCVAEQSYLAVINSQEETDFLVNLTISEPRCKGSGNYLRGLYHLGFHNRLNDGWRTVKGAPLDTCDSAWWGNYKPDVSDRDQCGAMFYTGRLNHIDCDLKCFFICEHEVEQRVTEEIDTQIQQ